MIGMKNTIARFRLDDEAPAAAGRRGGDEPRKAARPRKGAGHTLQKASEVQRPHRVGEAEGDGGERQQRQSRENGRFDAEARGRHPARNSRQEGTDGVHRLQHSRARLAQVELVDVVRQKRRKRCEEHRVDQDDRADEQEKPTHVG